jgi:DNA polymerase Ligase (LigD)
MPRYVILEHDYPELHWDLMLEVDNALRTWRLKGALSREQCVQAQSAPDHRLLYLDYEGPVSGDRGHVVRWDEGDYQWLDDQKMEWRVRLAGRRLRGILSLRFRDGNAIAQYEPAS